MVFLAALALSLVVGTHPNRLRDRVSRPFVKALPQEWNTPSGSAAISLFRGARKPAENFIRIAAHSRRRVPCVCTKTEIRPSWGSLFLHPIPENADLHTPEKTVLL